MLAATRIPRALAALAEGPAALYTRGDAVATAHPVLFGMVCAGLTTVAADLTVQTVVEKKQLHEVDKRRTITFGLFGVGYLGGIQYAVFNKVLPAMQDPYCARRRERDRRLLLPHQRSGDHVEDGR